MGTAGVPFENLKVMLGYQNRDITTRFPAPDSEEPLLAANRVCGEKFGKTSSLVVLKHKAHAALALSLPDVKCEVWRARRDSNSRPPGS